MTQFRAFAIFLLVAGFSASAFAQPVKIACAETLVPLNQKWVAAYKSAHSSATIEITGAPASEAALEALKAKKSDIATVSRRLRRKETEAVATALGARPAEYKVAVCAVAVYVHSGNTIKALDVDQLESIIKGETSNWKDAGGKEGSIVVYVPKDSPKVLEYIREEFLAGKELPSSIRALPSAELAQAIGKEQNAIGFGDALSLSGVRVLGIKRAQSSPPEVPTLQTISEMDYPVAHYVYDVISTEAEKGDAKSFLDWVRSDDGQKAIEGSGFYPIPLKQRIGAAK